MASDITGEMLKKVASLLLPRRYFCLKSKILSKILAFMPQNRLTFQLNFGLSFSTVVYAYQWRGSEELVPAYDNVGKVQVVKHYLSNSHENLLAFHPSVVAPYCNLWDEIISLWLCKLQHWLTWRTQPWYFSWNTSCCWYNGSRVLLAVAVLAFAKHLFPLTRYTLTQGAKNKRILRLYIFYYLWTFQDNILPRLQKKKKISGLTLTTN